MTVASSSSEPIPERLRYGVSPIITRASTTLQFTSSRQPTLSFARVDAENIDKLAPIVTILATYNRRLPGAKLEQLEAEIGAHATLSTLKRMKGTYAMVTAAMDVKLRELPLWLWSHMPVEDLETVDRKLMDAMRFIFTDFVNVCTNPVTAPQAAQSERTFLVDHVVPILRSLATQSQLLAFNWCGAVLKQKARQARPATTARNVDALGYNAQGYERLVVEISGGHTVEQPSHAADDTIKIIHSLLCVLKGDAQGHLNASLATYKKIKTFGIQTIEAHMVLFEMHLGDDLTYEYKEVMSASVPINDEQRTRWLQVAEMLAYLMLELHEQDAHLTTLQKEHDGALQLDTTTTIRSNLYPATANSPNS
ncbi:hypothetical protein BC940DRAFT_278516 [Gongronella butleri]|nr:hypothetical protein BC940DRAFT_278516 [Gongronella butleri]